MPMNPRTHDEAVADFWAKVDRGGGPDACWPWTAGKDKDGYGKFAITVDGRHVDRRAHRYAYELTRGRIERELCVLHSCDNPPCVNPSHLRAGTADENNKDKARKGRAWRPHGELQGAAKLTAASVAEIRRRVANGETQRSVAAAFGVSQSTVSHCVTGARWAHLTKSA